MMNVCVTQTLVNGVPKTKQQLFQQRCEVHRKRILSIALRISLYFFLNINLTHAEYVGGPLAEGLLLATHLVPLGEFQKALPAQLTQKVVHVLAKSAEVGIRT